jgi:hypothetical protein
VISKVDSNKAVTHSGNYQDNVTILLTCEHDNNATANDELNGGGTITDLDVGAEAADGVLSGIEKVDNPTPSANQEDHDSFRRSSKVSVQALNIANHRLMRFYSSKAVGVLMTAVPC